MQRVFPAELRRMTTESGLPRDERGSVSPTTPTSTESDIAIGRSFAFFDQYVRGKASALRQGRAATLPEVTCVRRGASKATQLTATGASMSAPASA